MKQQKRAPCLVVPVEASYRRGYYSGVRESRGDAIHRGRGANRASTLTLRTSERYERGKEEREKEIKRDKETERMETRDGK